MTLVGKIKELLKEYQETYGYLDDKDYEKLFVKFYLEYQDQYLAQSVKPVKSNGKINYKYAKHNQ